MYEITWIRRRFISPDFGCFEGELPAVALGQQHDEDHSPDHQQRVSDRVSHGVTQSRNLTLGAVIDHCPYRKPKMADGRRESVDNQWDGRSLEGDLVCGDWA